jgi:hypothetical protein
VDAVEVLADAGVGAHFQSRSDDDGRESNELACARRRKEKAGVEM